MCEQQNFIVDCTKGDFSLTRSSVDSSTRSLTRETSSSTSVV